MLVEPGVALRLDLALLRAGRVAVARVELLDDVHARGDGAERWEVRVERRVVAEVDEDLRRPRIRACRSEGHTAEVVVNPRHDVVRDRRPLPSGRYLRVRADPELHDEVRHDAEE